MPLNAEAVYWGDAWTGHDTYTATWTMDFAPRAIMAKVTSTFYMEYTDADNGMLGVHIVRFRRRLPSDADQTIISGRPSAFDRRMTSVTYALFIFNCQGNVVLNLGYWD